MNKLQKLAYAGFALVPPAPPGGVTGSAWTLDSISDMLQTIAQFLIYVSMFIAVIMIVYGGIRYMFSSDDPKAAKTIITNGLIGAGIVLAVGALLQTVGYIVSFRG